MKKYFQSVVISATVVVVAIVVVAVVAITITVKSVVTISIVYVEFKNARDMIILERVQSVVMYFVKTTLQYVKRRMRFYVSCVLMHILKLARPVGLEKERERGTGRPFKTPERGAETPL
jgi:hypothetical protein